jgi:hypothetical protein
MPTPANRRRNRLDSATKRRHVLEEAEREILTSVERLARARELARKAFLGDNVTANNWLLGVMQKINAEIDGL